MYHLITKIWDDDAVNQIPEVSFNPSGSMFAVSFKQSNEVRVFDSYTRSILRVYKNPDAELDRPHGILMTDKHVVVSAGYSFPRPSKLNIYRISASSDKPINIYEVPYQHLCNAHSIAMHENILVITYYGIQNNSINAHITGAIVSYRFDDEVGMISEVIDIHESCFNQYGEAKGVSFNSDGSKLYVTFGTDEKPISISSKYVSLLASARRVLKKRGAKGLAGKILTDIFRSPDKQQAAESSPKNGGIAIFKICDDGKISNEPIIVFQKKEYCRFENIDIIGDMAIITDTINNAVYVHDIKNDSKLEKPIQTITEHMTLPHGAKISPDRRILVVTNYGLHVVKNVIQWGKFTSPRGDNIHIYEFQGPCVSCRV